VEGVLTVSCTCAGTAPGFPQHEPFCGSLRYDSILDYQEEPEVDEDFDHYAGDISNDPGPDMFEVIWDGEVDA
jgi:hypothetical protein